MIGRLVLGVCLLVGCMWLGGFVWFVQTASLTPAALPHADGIVVLTGGSNRVAQGLRLLQQGQAPRLLVSGVPPGTSIETLARAAGLDAAPIADRVTLGQSAVSTHGNAEETAAWVARYQVQSLIVVTAFYHMPRALAELHRALPQTLLYARPVLPDTLAAGNAGRPLALLLSEYTKWLAVRIGVPRYARDQRWPAPVQKDVAKDAS